MQHIRFKKAFSLIELSITILVIGGCRSYLWK
ncbi:MAG: prepilin-type N-terminal cleavage/methylation domain-containing protein [Pelagibacterales bacterium]|nr:prepilin-type N-terminal cleavage/methylation domain-containing protein [Pelagibacterales bacterium]